MIENYRTTQVNAVDISRMFEEDEEDADTKYLTKPLAVMGEIVEISQK